MITIREAREEDFEAIWEIFHVVVERGDTYAFDPEIDREGAHTLWMGPGIHTYVAMSSGDVVGTFIIKANQPALGSHVANAAFMVHPGEQGRGIGRAMAEEALDEAKRLGFSAMQFNLVVVTNESAIHLWKRLGFQEVGRIPEAFRHRDQGLVDALIMHRRLDDPPEESGS
jgi:L-amino acid N-acyltransferase YncA